VRARLPARQILPGLAALLDDLGRRSVGHVGGHDIDRAMSSGAWWPACNLASSAMPWTVASSDSKRAASSSPPQK